MIARSQYSMRIPDEGKDSRLFNKRQADSRAEVLRRRGLFAAYGPVVIGIILSFGFRTFASVFGQVGPAEIINPQLKKAEQAYLSQMLEVNRAVVRIHFPFTFALSRYAGLSPKEQAEADARGLEFVHFHDRLVLKLTGNYYAAYNADVMTSNQRAGRLFNDVVMPLLRLIREHFTPDDQFDAFGFEIAYHIRTHGRGFEYEGKEILVLVMDKSDALRLPTETEARRQEVLNRSEIYLDGKPFGLALGMRDPYDVGALVRSARGGPTGAIPQGVHPDKADPANSTDADGAPESPGMHDSATQLRRRQSQAGDSLSTKASGPAPLEVDLGGLQTKYQKQLNDLATEGAAKYHLVDYASPSFVVFHGRVALQITLRNPAAFDKDNSSIYKRAAQGFDLFLAPQLKPILDKIPITPDISVLDVTVIDQLEGESGRSSEALEFVLPLEAARRFADAEITNQDLIDKSVVLVNGVRIALNLQLVE